MIIRTAYKTNAKGTSQITAKGGGHQRTVPFNPAWSTARNHGNAAGTLAQMLGLDWHDGIEHDSNDSGSVHTFAF